MNISLYAGDQGRVGRGWAGGAVPAHAPRAQINTPLYNTPSYEVTF